MDIGQRNLPTWTGATPLEYWNEYMQDDGIQVWRLLKGPLYRGTVLECRQGDT